MIIEAKFMNINKMPLISIIMPVFNAIAYLPETVKSIQNQSYKNFEVISIDDLSTDGTFEYMKSVAGEDSRFFIKQRTDKGWTAAKAIEYALPYCHGEYYWMMTHDDLLDNDFFEKCIQKAIETDADIVVPNLLYYYGEKKYEKPQKYPQNNDYSQIIDGRTAFYLSLSWKMHNNSLQKMNLVMNTGFKAEYYNSCEFYARKRFLYAGKIVFCDTNFYYRQNSKSALTKQVNYFNIDILTTDIMLYELLNLNNYSNKEMKKRLFFICLNFAKFKNIFWKKKFTSEQELYINKSFDNAKKKIIKYVFQDKHLICLIPLYLYRLYPYSILKKLYNFLRTY
jgi:glycosyltransferase involved in cell wall biosynthesis